MHSESKSLTCVHVRRARRRHFCEMKYGRLKKNNYLFAFNALNAVYERKSSTAAANQETDVGTIKASINISHS